MRTRELILGIAICLVAPNALRAQSPSANPVVASAQEIFDRQTKYIVGAAEEMPGDKYGYQPTPEQWSFGKLLSHVAQSSFNLCAMLSDSPVPQNWKVTESDPKEKLIPAVKASFDFCSKALANLQDSKLGDTVTFLAGRKVPRARVLIELTDDVEDHYSQLASYLRLNQMAPPSAQPK